MPPDRPLVTAAGAALDGLIAATIDATSARAAARATLTFAARRLAPDAFDDPELRVALTDARTNAPLLTFRPDTVTTDRIANTTTVEGRDLAALLIDQSLEETFVNRPASDIATDLAARHGLTPQVTATTTLAGRLFASDCALLALHTEWDLLAALADALSFDLAVPGQTLVFAPPADAAPIVLHRAACIALHLTTSPAAARAVDLTVQSWDAAAARPVTHTATRGRGTSRRQHLARANLNHSDAQALAERTLADLARYERTATLAMPGETAITTRSTIELDGLAYRVARIRRDWSARGFTQRLELTAP